MGQPLARPAPTSRPAHQRRGGYPLAQLRRLGNEQTQFQFTDPGAPTNAHQQDRRVRFWGAPDQSVFWAGMLANGVDLINTDNLDGAQAFLLKH